MTSSPVFLPAEEWRAREAAHAAVADALTAGHRARSARGEKHPIEDFLFTYYSYKPAILRRWHPGAGVVLADAAETPRAAWRGYVSAPGHPGALVVDRTAIESARPALFTLVDRMLRLPPQRTARFGCFGLHEWAMVYRQEEHRHAAPLRLGQDGTDAVVEAHDVRCTHFDAFRFFTPAAVPRNETSLTRDRQADTEQSGCLHAGMDLYKWVVKLGPLVPGELLLETFELARDIRLLDMQASPYDMTAWGASPVKIEEPEGKAEYVARQRAFAARGDDLRARILRAWQGEDTSVPATAAIASGQPAA